VRFAIRNFFALAMLFRRVTHTLAHNAQLLGWCSWLSRAPHTREVPSSILGSSKTFVPRSTTKTAGRGVRTPDLPLTKRLPCHLAIPAYALQMELNRITADIIGFLGRDLTQLLSEIGGVREKATTHQQKQVVVQKCARSNTDI
jgi:hypothetical protein